MTQPPATIAALDRPPVLPRTEPDTAVLVTAGASADLLLAEAAGLPLIVRAALALQRGGIQRVLVWGGPEARACRDLLPRYPQITLMVRWLVDGEPLAADPSHTVLLVHPLVVFSPETVRLLRHELRSAGDGGAPCAVAIVGRQVDGPPTGPALLAVPAKVLLALDDCRRPTVVADPTPGELVAKRMLDRLTTAVPVRMVPAGTHGCWAIRDERDLGLVERRLIASAKSINDAFEGWIDTYLNRPLSRVLTRAFLKLRLSPNTVTALSVALGLMAAAAFAFGTYAAGVVGALLFQLSAIVDCCDGEVARLTGADSAFGAQLDLIGDNVVHVALFAGVAWSVYVHRPAWEMLPSTSPLLLGMAAIAGNLLSFWLVMRARRLRDTGRLQDQQQEARVEMVLKKLANRDFSVVVLAFAVAGWLEPFLWLAAVGANVFWLWLAALTRPSSLALEPRG